MTPSAHTIDQVQQQLLNYLLRYPQERDRVLPLSMDCYRSWASPCYEPPLNERITTSCLAFSQDEGGLRVLLSKNEQTSAWNNHSIQVEGSARLWDEAVHHLHEVTDETGAQPVKVEFGKDVDIPRGPYEFGPCKCSEEGPWAFDIDVQSRQAVYEGSVLLHRTYDLLFLAKVRFVGKPDTVHHGSAKACWVDAMKMGHSGERLARVLKKLNRYGHNLSCLHNKGGLGVIFHQ